MTKKPSQIKKNKKGNLCSICGSNTVMLKSTAKRGRYSHRCYQCHHRPWIRDKKNFCELCGFIAHDKIQLDIHHLDGNHKNNNQENLMTICANCHRLEHR